MVTVNSSTKRNAQWVRAVVGSALGSGLTLLFLVVGPQEIQRIVAIGGNGWPAAVLLSGLVAYMAGFLGNHQRPLRWPAVWIGGWLVGVVLVVAFVLMFGSPGD